MTPGLLERKVILKANEAVGGLKHAGLKWERLLLRRPPDRFIPRFSRLALPLQSSSSTDLQAGCPICGYALVRLQFADGWTLDACSAMPALFFDNPKFVQWQSTMPREKLPTSCV